jgi:hypothetical protein
MLLERSHFKAIVDWHVAHGVALSSRRDEPHVTHPTSLSDWYAVSFDSTHVYRRAALPTDPWQDSFAWDEIIRVCYERGEDFLASDTFYIFVKDRAQSFSIPSEANGGAELWGEIIRRGLFDAKTSIKISVGELQGICCWPPLDSIINDE